jgi:hypothetical protein
MQNPGEEIVGEYLKIIGNCDFVEYNLHTPDTQGEIDVVGINAKEQILYVCEVATHLVTGLQYTKNNQPDNVNRFISKFKKNIQYARKSFPEFEHHFMIWTPIVKNQGSNAKHNQMRDIEQIKAIILNDFDEEIKAVINQDYADCLTELRIFAAKETKELQSPIMRILQIEEKLNKHLVNLKKRGI